MENLTIVQFLVHTMVSILQDSLGACAPQVTGVELDSLISSVKDLLPELGEGFIEVYMVVEISLVGIDGKDREDDFEANISISGSCFPSI